MSMASNRTKRPSQSKQLSSRLGIHIKPSHKGLLHKDLGVPQGEKIPKEKIDKALHSSSAAVRKRANFARNFGK